MCILGLVLMFVLNGILGNNATILLYLKKKEFVFEIVSCLYFDILMDCSV